MSMTREEAVKILKDGGIEVCGAVDRISEFIAALDVALDALIPPTREDELDAENRELKERIVNWRKYMAPTREEVEQVWRGKWIGSADGYADGELVYDTWTCSECGHVIDEEDNPDILPQFCPKCYAAMTDKAVDMVMERWKEMVDGDK